MLLRVEVRTVWRKLVELDHPRVISEPGYDISLVVFSTIPDYEDFTFPFISFLDLIKK